MQIRFPPSKVFYIALNLTSWYFACHYLFFLWWRKRHCLLYFDVTWRTRRNKLLSISSQYNSHPTILVNETSSSSLQTHFRRPFFFSSQNVTYPDRQMCWSTSLYSSPTKPPSLFRSAIFRYERRDVKLGLEKKKILFLFEKVLLTDSHLSGGKPCQLLRVFSGFAETPTGFLDSITGTC